MPEHKTEDYKQSTVYYYLIGDNTQEEVLKIKFLLNENL
jgi:hypothetical protein